MEYDRCSRERSRIFPTRIVAGGFFLGVSKIPGMIHCPQAAGLTVLDYIAYVLIFLIFDITPYVVMPNEKETFFDT